MQEILEGWKEIHKVHIPPIKKHGFQESVIIRTPISPLLPTESKIKPEQKTEEKQKDDLFIDESEEEGTVLLIRPSMIKAQIIRDKTGESVPVSTNPFVVGKGKAADYHITDNPTVSRRHCSIFQKDNSFYLQDLDSLNHTFVEEKEITEAVELTDGMSFKIADEVFHFSIAKG